MSVCSPVFSPSSRRNSIQDRELTYLLFPFRSEYKSLMLSRSRLMHIRKSCIRESPQIISLYPQNIHLDCLSTGIMHTWVNVLENHPAFVFEQLAKILKACLPFIHFAKHNFAIKSMYTIAKAFQPASNDFTFSSLGIALDHKSGIFNP